MRSWALLLRMSMFTSCEDVALELSFADWSRYCAVLVVFLGNVPGQPS